MASIEHEVAIIGAGAAGLTALRELTQAGCDAVCIEARDRIGGRAYTIHDPFCPVPIELGAEFVHGRPPEIWNLINAEGVRVYDTADDVVTVGDGKIQNDDDEWELSGRVMHDMRRAAKSGPDQTFLEFLQKNGRSEKAKQIATRYVEGFNAARKEVIGIASLAQDAEAADRIDGGRSFRLIDGYDSLLDHLLRGPWDLARRVRFNRVAHRVEWGIEGATVEVRSLLTGVAEQIACRRVVVTVPLGVLQTEAREPGAISFVPEPTEALAAARTLQFGQVVRVVLRFREAFWERRPDLADAGFIFSSEKLFPTWWTPLHVRAPIVTGWSAGPAADPLLGRPGEEVVAAAIKTLSTITGVPCESVNDLLNGAYFHDWHADPFSRGAYSYAPAGGLAARAELAEPVGGTLYFAGEATELEGHSGTVHGAMASGKRVAHQVLRDRDAR